MKPLGQSATSELISAMSSLNMYPDTIYLKKTSDYLSESDRNVSHAMEHLESVRDVLMELKEEVSSIKLALHYRHGNSEAAVKALEKIQRKL